MSYTTTIYTATEAPAICYHFDENDIDHTNGWGDFLLDLVSLDGEYETAFKNGDIDKKKYEDIKKSIDFFLKHEDEHLTFRP